MKAGQPIFILIPMLSPGERATMDPLLIEAENQVSRPPSSSRSPRSTLTGPRTWCLTTSAATPPWSTPRPSTTDQDHPGRYVEAQGDDRQVRR